MRPKRRLQLSVFQGLASRVTALPCAVYSHEAIRPFASANREGETRPFYPTGFGSRVMEGGDAFIQSVTIEHALPGFSPTFICMDVEGVELEALKRTGKTTRAHRPDMGICVYHSPSHLWEIPLYLNNLEVGYRFYLRNYTSFTSETVLYVVSE